jgi:hypothetical protein
MKEIRRRTRVVGAFPDAQSCLNLAAARPRYIAGKTWSTKCHMNMRPLYQQHLSETEAVASMEVSNVAASRSALLPLLRCAGNQLRQRASALWQPKSHARSALSYTALRPWILSISGKTPMHHIPRRNPPTEGGSRTEFGWTTSKRRSGFGIRQAAFIFSFVIMCRCRRI